MSLSRIRDETGKREGTFYNSQLNARVGIFAKCEKQSPEALCMTLLWLIDGIVIFGKMCLATQLRVGVQCFA